MNPVALVLGIIALIVSGVVKLHAVIFGQQLVMPWLFVVAVIVALALAVALLVMIRLLVRDGRQQRPVVVRT